MITFDLVYILSLSLPQSTLRGRESFSVLHSYNVPFCPIKTLMLALLHEENLNVVIYALALKMLLPILTSFFLISAFLHSSLLFSPFTIINLTICLLSLRNCISVLEGS